MKKHKYYFNKKTEICYDNFLKLRSIKILKKNFKIKNTLKQKLMLKNFKINQMFNINKLKKYCMITGRLRFIINGQKYSRISFRELSSKGLLSGIYKK